MKQALSLFALVAAMPALADEPRQLDAHEHGVGTLNIAIDGKTVSMAFEAPGADVVGFEYAAESEADLAKIDAAITTLDAPLDLFVVPDAAACTVTRAKAELESDHGHEEHGHDDHGDEDHGDDDHADKAGHSEFHAQYTLNCDNPDALTDITFAYFETFPNAKEVDVQLISPSGAKAFEVKHDAPELDLDR